MAKENIESHGAYFGIQKVSYKDTILQDLDKKFEEALEVGFNKVSGTYKEYKKDYLSVKILDTFITGFNQNLLTKIIQKSNLFGYSIQILLLNPFSELAQVRSKELNDTNYLVRLNQGLDKISLALEDRVDPTSIISGDSQITKDILHKIEVQKNASKVDLEIKFTSQLTELPVYIFSQFAVKGLIIKGSKAENNPWLFIIDDPLKKFDLYAVLSRNFNDIWHSDEAISASQLVEKTLDGQIPKLEEIRRLIASSLIEKALKSIKHYVNANLSSFTTYINTVVSLENRWNSMTLDLVSGVVTKSEFNHQKSKFVSDLLDFINLIEK